MRKRVDQGEFEKEPIIAAHPYKKGFMIFTSRAIYHLSNEKTRLKKKKPKQRRC